MLMNPYVFRLPDLFTPVPGITGLAVLGTSIEYQAFDPATTTAQLYLASAHNLPGITVYNYGQTGATAQTVYNFYMNTAKAAMLARTNGATSTMWVVNSLPNSISLLMPMATADPTALANHKNYWDLLIADMKATFGAERVIIEGTMFRNTAPSGSRVTDESIGAAPFNSSWVKEQSQASGQWVDGEAWVNQYNLGFNWYSFLFQDDTHFTVLGSQMLQQMILDSVAAKIKGVYPPRIPKKANPIGDQKPRSSKVFVQYTNAANVYRSFNFLGAVVRGYNYTADIPHLCGVKNYEPSLGLKARTALLSGSQTLAGPGDISRTVTNDVFRDSYQFQTATGWQLIDTFYNITPNTKCLVEVSGCRSNTGTLITEISFDQATVAGSYEAARTAGQPSQKFSGEAFSNANGELSIWARRAASNTVGLYVNVVSVDPQG